MAKAKITRPVLLAALSLGVANFQPAYAQDAEQSVDSSTQIQDIVVSARRRDETLQQTPVAITAIAPSQLEGAAAVTIGDLQGAAPNVLITVQNTGAASANISIRGIAFADIEKSFDPAVGVMVDGVYIGTSTGQLLDFFDIDSIEILRGPQGTLFGRNTISGVINIRRSRPTGEFGGKFEASYGKYNQFGARAVLNVPIVQDVLAAKVFEFHTDGSGYYRDARTGRLRGGSSNDNFGASFLLTPSSSFDALLTIEKQSQNFDPVVSSLSQTGDAFCFTGSPTLCDRDRKDDLYVTSDPDTAEGRYRAEAATLEMNLDVGPVKLTSLTSYRDSKESQKQYFGTGGLYDAFRGQKYNQFSQELRAAGKLTDSFDYVAGVYYFDSKYTIQQVTSVFFGAPSVQDTTGKSQSYAGFVDFNWEIFENVRISGGGRYTHDKKSLQTALDNVMLTPGEVSKSWSKFTPKIGVDFRPSDEIMFYGSWSRGYRSGGFNGRGLTTFSASTPYNPETVDAYEAGIKTQFWDRKATFNIAGFYTDYQDIQQTTTNSTTGGTGNETIVANAAAAKIKGIEADLTVKPVRGFTVRSSLGYTDAKFKGFIVNQPAGANVYAFDYSNVGLIYAPKITFSANAEYETPMVLGQVEGKIKLNAGYRYLARYDQQIAADPATTLPTGPSTAVIPVTRNDPRVRSDAQNLIDASLSFIWDMSNDGAKARVTFYGRNLLNDRGPANGFTVGAFPAVWAFAGAREPLTYGVQVGFEF